MLRMKVKEVAEAKNISMARLGRMADLDPRTMRQVYRDPYRDVAYSTLVKLAKALDVDIAELTEEVPDTNAQ